MKSNAASTLVLAGALALAGCTALPEAGRKPEAALPAQWAPPAAGAADPVTQDWWRSFGSAELDGLVAQARRQSLDLAAAAARVQQAAAQARQAGAALWPELRGQADASRQGRLGGQADVAGTQAGLGLSASYLVDLWGGNQALQQGAEAGLRASLFDQDTVRLAVTAGVAGGWLQAVALRERLAIADLQWHSAGRLLALVESRHRAGAASALELAQQRGLVASQRRSRALLAQQAGSAETAVALLLGQAGGLAIGTANLQALRAPAVDAGVPAALLARRPDIARAEARLAAADADVVAARAAMLPSLTLGGSLSAGGGRLQRVLDNPWYALTAGLTAPLFDAGRLAAGRDAAAARREELLAAYQRTVLQAFAEAQTALQAVDGAEAQARAQAEVLAQAESALAWSESRYRAGAETLLTLIDAQRTLYAAQDDAAQLRLARLQARVGLYQALGGGWCSPQAQSSLVPSGTSRSGTHSATCPSAS
ncbi:MAG: efflux transporter outer membrane subunit [Comamonas sp.]